MGEWRKVKFGDVVKMSSGKTPSKGNPVYWNGDIPWISASSMNDIYVSSSDEQITQRAVTDATSLVDAGTILILVRGSILHQRIPISISLKQVAFNQDVKALTLKSDSIDKSFFLAWLLSCEKELLAKVEFTGIGAGKLDTEVLNKLEIPLPDLKIQKQIGSFAKALIDKIELNRKMNETLEAMAQAIFKSWFVDFDPVRAKAEGRDTGLPKEIADLFPDGFEESEVGEVPRGWRVCHLGDFLEPISETFKFKDGTKVIFLNTSDILTGEVLVNTYSDAKALPGQAKKRIKKGDILFSEIRPANGRHALIDFDADDYVVSTKLMVLRAKHIDPILPYFLLTQQATIDQLQMLAESRSGTFPQITFDQVKPLIVLMPSTPLLNRFVTTIRTIHEQRVANVNESKALALTRDNLLPSLVGGFLPTADKLCAQSNQN